MKKLLFSFSFFSFLVTNSADLDRVALFQELVEKCKTERAKKTKLSVCLKNAAEQYKAKLQAEMDLISSVEGLEFTDSDMRVVGDLLITDRLSIDSKGSCELEEESFDVNVKKLAQFLADRTN